MGLPPLPRAADGRGLRPLPRHPRRAIRSRRATWSRHSDVAPDRKQDPGELFDWEGLAANGVGLWPPAGPDAAPGRRMPPALLAAIGYRTGPAARRPARRLPAALAAGARRWRGRCRDPRAPRRRRGADRRVTAAIRAVAAVDAARRARRMTPPRQVARRPLAPASGGAGGKSGLHGNTVPANGRRGRPQGQCHRKQTARRTRFAARRRGQG